MRSLDQFKSSLGSSASSGAAKSFQMSSRQPSYSNSSGCFANLKLVAEKLVKEQASSKTDLDLATLVEPMQITCWVVVNFSAPCDTTSLCRDLIRCSKAKGMHLDQPYDVIEENYQDRNPAPSRVEKMFEAIKRTLPGPPRFILCILPERKNSDIYGPWKRKCLVEFGIVTQCIAPTKVNDQYLTNLLLKINTKMGGINSLLSMEYLSC